MEELNMNETRRTYDDITEESLDANVKWFRERKQAREQFKSLYIGLKRICEDIDNQDIKDFILHTVKEMIKCFNRM